LGRKLLLNQLNFSVYHEIFVGPAMWVSYQAAMMQAHKFRVIPAKAGISISMAPPRDWRPRLSPG
jgi:hypothetical protein